MVYRKNFVPQNDHHYNDNCHNAMISHRYENNDSPTTVPTNHVTKPKKNHNSNRRTVARSSSSSSSSTGSLTSTSSSSSMSSSHSNYYRQQPSYDIVAMDCEMVGIGMDGLDSMLARVTIIDWNHNVIYDKYVKPQHPVIDFRTHVSGITKENLESENAIDFTKCRRQVNNIIHNKIVVGHGLTNDFQSLQMIHPWYMTRDTAYYQPFMKIKSTAQHNQSCYYCPRKLKELSIELLQMNIQGQSHSSIEDSIASLELYKLVQIQFEQQIQYQCMKITPTYIVQQHQRQPQQPHQQQGYIHHQTQQFKKQGAVSNHNRQTKQQTVPSSHQKLVHHQRQQYSQLQQVKQECLRSNPSSTLLMNQIVTVQ